MNRATWQWAFEVVAVPATAILWSAAGMHNSLLLIPFLWLLASLLVTDALVLLVMVLCERKPHALWHYLVLAAVVPLTYLSWQVESDRVIAQTKRQLPEYEAALNDLRRARLGPRDEVVYVPDLHMNALFGRDGRGNVTAKFIFDGGRHGLYYADEPSSLGQDCYEPIGRNWCYYRQGGR